MDTPHGPFTILLAEDEAMVRMVAIETLQDAGYTVLEAADGNEALETLQSIARIDLLVSDVKMPGLNGYQVAELGLALRPGLRVVLMTGYAQDPIPKVLADAGTHVLYKPFNLEQLTETVDVILRPRP
jgi:CheY-like chemotaxis protein